MTLGVPRMKEIIGGSDNIATPCMTVVLKAAIAQNPVAAEALSRGLAFTLLRDIVQDAAPVYEPDLAVTHVAEDGPMVRAHRAFLAPLARRNASNWVIRFELDRAEAMARSIEPRGLADLMQRNMPADSVVISSEAEDERWVVRVYLMNLEGEIEAAVQKSTSKSARPRKRKSTATSGSITSRKRRRFADLTDFCSGGDSVPIPLHSIYPQIERERHSVADTVQWMVVRNRRDDLMNNMRVCGIPGITHAMARRTNYTRVDAATGAVSTEAEYVVDVRGTNLAQVLALHAVDSTMLISNNVREVEREFGIDAAAHVLFQELRGCLCADGARVDDRYIELLVDVMTHRGSVMAMSRHGLNRIREHGVLKKVTFEETIEMLFDAAAAGEHDDLKGVSEKIMLGQRISVGTGLCEVFGNVDGHRVHLGSTAQAPVEREDLRVMCSVVTEPGGADLDVMDEERMPTGAAEEKLERALVGNAGTQQVTSAIDTGGHVVNMELYEHHMFEEPPPIIDEADVLDEPPFHPSSPSMFTVMHNITSRQFHPSSPSQFM